MAPERPRGGPQRRGHGGASPVGPARAEGPRRDAGEGSRPPRRRGAGDRRARPLLWDGVHGSRRRRRRRNVLRQRVQRRAAQQDHRVPAEGHPMKIYLRESVLEAARKRVAWGTKGNPKLGHYNFYPIYDWGFRDVWKAIHEHGWPYCTIYDRMYQYGYRVQDMRVSNLYHETALKHLLFLQEIEPQTWERLTRRLPGIHAIKHLRNSALRVPDELPPMFTSWVEYRDYLLRHLVQDEGIRTSLAKTFADLDRRYEGIGSPERMYRVMVASILVQDGDVMTKLRNWENSPIVSTWRRWKRGDNIQRKHLLTNPHING
ncbi:MAG: DUF3440 domain-containing protein [Burkholderiales bacterium]|nr:DUF3440 domain-containing protein [Burkholderiales bacterium]